MSKQVKAKKKRLTFGQFLANNSVPIMFIIFCAICIPISGFSPSYLLNEIVTRMGRNTFLILCLLIPIMAGMGLNFGMTLGAMAIVGSIEDGITGDYSILATKSVLDFIIIMVMSCSMGRGAVFSAIPVAICRGVITALAGLLRPVMTAAALANLSMVGSVLIFCVGVNLVWGKKVRVANLLPAIVIAVIAAFLSI